MPFHKNRKASPNYREGFLKEIIDEKLSYLKLENKYQMRLLQILLLQQLHLSLLSCRLVEALREQHQLSRVVHNQ